MVAVPVYKVLKSINSMIGCFNIHVVKFWLKTVKFSLAGHLRHMVTFHMLNSRTNKV